ncbi:MAG: DegV family protein [Candidatus Heimdallarchaeota archaeon]|nr:DegV family protein [Candidatus Heimdallarchaeota archaeon]
MKKVSIVTDGSCDLPKDLIEKFNIHIAPFQVIFGTNAYQLYGDFGDISKEDFYDQLASCAEMPTTAVPKPKSFQDAFDNANNDAESIIAIFISKELSGTIQSAMRIVPLIENADITIVDSKVSASCLGLLAVHAAKMAQNNSTKKEILTVLNELIPQTRLVVVMDTMEYLFRGGRIGRAKKFFGQALNIKPILHFEDGVVAPGGTLRGREEVIRKMKQMAPYVVENAITDNIFIWHTRDLDTAKELLEIMEEVNDNGKEIRIQEAGPVIGTHTGPKSLGFTYIGHYDKDWLLKNKK